jgi:L-fuculokinase
MIDEAKAVQAGCNGLLMVPELFPGGFSGKPGTLQGFTHQTSRSHIYRASLEALSYYLRHGLEMLQQIGNYQATEVICVGGGSKNSFWNQIRADVLGIPLRALKMNETTALGAALTTFTGLGIYPNIEEAVASSNTTYMDFLPGEESERYNDLFRQYEEKIFK